MDEPAVAARRMWTLYEPVHVVTYFAPEALRAFQDAGLRGFWRGYFAGRAAPVGAVDAPLVIATFGNFAPSFVRRALPAATDLAAARPWARLGPARITELAELLIPIASACATAVPYPNPVGVPRPAA